MQNKILELLMNADGYVSGQQISNRLGVSRQAVWKAVNSLKEKGYKIESVTNRGYRLAEQPLFLSEYKIRKSLKTAVLGRNLIVLDAIGSTNDYLKISGAEGCPNGTVAAAREQTGGKGRLGRVWTAKKDDSLTFSFLLRPRIAPNEVSSVTPLVGLAVCRALRAATGLDCKIKWPNDVIVGTKKLVGILTEMSAELDAVEYVITGIGINVDTAEFSDELKSKATSIFLETGERTDKSELLARILNEIERCLAENDLKLSGAALSEYTALCVTVGRQILFTRSGRQIKAEAVGVSENGELEVRLPDSTVMLVNSGEVTVQGIY